MLWAYSGGQMTQLNQCYCRLMMKFIVVPVCLNDKLYSELLQFGFASRLGKKLTDSRRSRGLSKEDSEEEDSAIYDN